MARPLTIRDLLSQGSTPSAEDGLNLERLGSFVARMFAQHMGRRRVTDPLGQVGLETLNTRGALSARTASRWTEGMGLGASMIEHWNSIGRAGQGRPGFMDGWDALDSREQVIVLDEDGETVYEDADLSRSQAPGGSVSLFGKARQARPSMARATQGRVPIQGGGRMSLRAVEALARGGLRTADQFLGTPASGKALGQHRSLSDAVQPLPATRPAGNALDAPRAQRSASLDGVRVDARTPALFSALQGIRGAFERGHRAERMLRNAPIGQPAPLQRWPVSDAVGRDRPVFSFFDAVEGDFLNLTADADVFASSHPERDAPLSEFAAGGGLASPVQRSSSTTGGAASSTQPPRTQQPSIGLALSQAASTVASGPGQPSVRPLTPGVFGTFTQPPRTQQPSIELSLSQVATTVASGPAQPSVRPLTPGVFGTFQDGLRQKPLQIVDSVVRDPVGRARARVQRSNISVPRMLVHEGRDGSPLGTRSHGSPMPEVGALRSSWRLAADGGRDLPMGALMGATESMAAHVVGSRALSTHQSMGAGDRPFEGVSAGYDSSVDAIDGVSWLVMESTPEQESQALGLALVPEGRPAVMLPSRVFGGSGRGLLATPRRSTHAASAEALVGPTPIRAHRSPGVRPSDGSLDALPLVRRSPGREQAEGLPLEGQSVGHLGRRLLGPSPRGVSRLGGPLFSRAYADADTLREIVRLESDPVTIGSTGEPAATGAAITSGSRRTAGPRIASGAQALSAERLSSVTGARTLRRLLGRPVVTARERLGVADGLHRALSSLGAEAPLLRAALQEESLSILSRGMKDGLVSPSVIRELTRLSSAKRRDVAELFSRAGWTRPELQMLSLTSDPSPERDVSLSGSVEGSTTSGIVAGERPMATSSTLIASSPQQASTQRLLKNLARVMTGTEALNVALRRGLKNEGTGGIGGSATAGMAAITPLMHTRPDAYFGSLAPPPRVAYGRLHDALTQLVSLAEAEVAASGGVVPAASHAGLVGQHRRVRAAASLIGRGSASMGPRGEGVASAPTEANPRHGYIGQTDAPMDPIQLGGLEARLGETLLSASRGPAGVARLVDRGSRQPLTRTGAGGDRGTSLARVESRLRRNAVGERVGLSSVLAPETMLHGMTGVRREAFPGRGELPGALLAPADRSSASEVIDENKPQSARAAKPRGSRGNIAQDVVARLLKAVDVRGGSRVAPTDLSPRLVSRLLNRLDRKKTVSMLSAEASGDFALAWLQRVDGQLSGIHTGLDDSSEQLASFFGVRPPGVSTLASDSPMHEAGFVSPVSSNLSRPSAEAGTPRGFGERPSGRGGSHRAAAASQQIDWSALPGGARTSTSHVNMESLGTTAFGAAESKGTPMPLVAPAVQAVAQSALRSSRSESTPVAPAIAPSKEGGAASSGKEAGASDHELEQLAQEMAGRISKRLGRERDRRGTWG